MTKAAVLDNLVNRETPEGIQLELKVAGPLPRAKAATLDFLLKTVVIGVFNSALMFMFISGGLGWMFTILFWFILNWFYDVGFEVWRGGQTPGKKILGLQVVLDNGAPLNWQASLLRNLVRFADALPLFYLAGLCCMAFSPGFRRLGDWAAGTLVIYKEEPEPWTLTQDLKDSAAFSLPPALAHFRLHMDEQKALRSFWERREKLSPERQAELWQILNNAAL